MQVYRIEHKQSGIGPYRHGDDIPSSAVRYPDPIHPPPFDDGMPSLPDGWNVRNARFAFESMGALWQWFSAYCKYIKGKGYVVATYEAERVQKGCKQLAFDKRHAKKIAVTPID